MAARIKTDGTVYLAGLRPEMAVAWVIIAGVFAEIRRDCVLTEAANVPGTHGRKSKHYIGAAIDIRTRHLVEQDIKQVIRLCKERLGPEFDVIRHDTHLHIEHDPK